MKLDAHIMYSDQLSSRIGNLKVHCQRRDSPALRMHLGSTLSSLDLNPPGMPPSAILIIRKLYDPLPGILRPGSSANYGQSVDSSINWRDALRVQLSNLYHNANRPAKAAIAGEQDAVLFETHAELLSCFCRDIVTGDGMNRWWWRRHFNCHLRTMTIPELTASLFMEAPRLVPPVISQLAEWRCAIKLIKLIDASDAQHILHAVLHEYGLAAFDEKLSSDDSSNRKLNLDSVDHSTEHPKIGTGAETPTSVYKKSKNEGDIRRFSHFVIGSSAALPWLNLFQEEIWEQSLMKEQSALLGIARILQTSPLTLRNVDFQKQIINWWSSVGQAVLQQPDSDLQSMQTSHAVITEERERVGDHKPKVNASDNPNMIFESLDLNRIYGTEKTILIADNKDGAERGRTGHLYIDNDIKAVNDQHDDRTEVEQDNHQHPPVREDLLEESPVLAAHIERSDDSQHNTSGIGTYKGRVEATEPDNEFTDIDTFFTDACFDTKIGGLLYLINLLQQLALPECLPQHCKVDQQVSRWALLDALSRALLGKYYFHFHKDPVWRILARLDRRRNKTLIGKGFQHEPDYKMPMEWWSYLAGNSAHRFHYALHNKHLRIWSDFGIIIDCCVSNIAKIENQVIVELQNYSQDISKTQICVGRYSQAPVANNKQLQAAGIDREFARLLSLLLPPIRHYLQDILSLSKLTPYILFNRLLRFDARIFVSSSHIDLVANINSSALAIRRSGLDQDPAWLPDYGRVVLFHFK